MSHVISQRTILKEKADVLVVGAGLAGIMAAISAAETGAKVCLVSSGQICSGSSFYPGTWGFGLVGPENQEDEKNLAETIARVGMDVVDSRLVDVFVSEINESIAYVERMGVPLKKADNPEEREFIPCFDHKRRSWNGIVKEDAKPVFLRRLSELDVMLMPFTEVTELLQSEGDAKQTGCPGHVTGAVAVREKQTLVMISCKAVVIASGGLGGLYRYRLNPGDVNGMGQYLALMAGASLVNLEFMQMMPGFLSPAYGTVFNEKIFRYTCSPAFDVWDEKQREELLEIRSGHGPYTSRLKSRQIDEAIARAWEPEPEGVWISYRQEIKENQAQFVKNYFDWLEKEKHLTPDDPVRVGIFAHASNGGIRIDVHGFTGVPGLYACGEVTGGMHGADRIGGLSTANGLVFGRRAGMAAALTAAGNEYEEADITAMLFSDEKGAKPACNKKLDKVRRMRGELKTRMHACGMIARNEVRCREMLDWLSCIGVEWNKKTNPCEGTEYYLETTRLKAELMVAGCLMRAVLLRRESRGSHNRLDYPNCDPALAHMIVCSFDGKDIVDRWI